MQTNSVDPDQTVPLSGHTVCYRYVLKGSADDIQQTTFSPNYITDPESCERGGPTLTTFFFLSFFLVGEGG